MSTPLATIIVETLSGFPEVGVTEAIIPLLSVDDDGYPNVCLLSRAQLEADLSHIFAIITGSTTKANVVRDRRATLVVFTSKAAYYCKLEVVSLAEQNGSLCAVLAHDSTKVDGDGSILMTPPRYIPTEATARFENWEASRSILSELRTTFIEQSGA